MVFPDWRKRPTIIESLPNTIKYALFIDEYGDHSFKQVDYAIRNNSIPSQDLRFLGLCGAIFHMEDHVHIMKDITRLKNNHWPPDGKHLLAVKGSQIPCKVCLHATEIKNNKGAFSKSIIDIDLLNKDIGQTLSNGTFSLMACVIDKYKYTLRYNKNRKAPYSVGAEFMLERFAYEINQSNSKAVVILESRGKKEDMSVLSYLSNIFDHGNYYNSKELFRNILGVFFNPKRSCDNQLSYIGLEIADLCCSTLVRSIIDPDSAKNNKAYQCIKSKIRGYPNKTKGYGVKLIP